MRFFLCLSFLLFVGSVSAKVFLTQNEALKLAFPDLVVERHSLFLDQNTVQAIEKMARSKVDSQLVNYYVGRGTQGVVGYAFFQTHIVRTMPETLMVVVHPDGRIKFVEMLAFNEPQDYLPPKRWFQLFLDRKSDGSLWVKRDIRNVTGATLTTQAVTEAVRRVLAIYEVTIKGKGATAK